ncbi:MAG: L-seryl-tRNA(Sec) selenium transferase [Bacillota bacterium]
MSILDSHQALLKELPAVDRVLNEPLLSEGLQRLPRRLVLRAVKETIDSYRREITGSSEPGQLAEKLDLSPAALAKEALLVAEKYAGMNFKALINATGVVIHTNLGRTPLARNAVEALASVAESYNNLEISLESGKRGSRQELFEELLCELSGAEAALVLNNNAAAVFLTLNTIASGKEVIVSRGQLVEIGGSFRIPEIMAASGARLVEIGTTNKTHPGDYQSAVNENTAAFLKVHTSNYHMVGFTAEVATADLSEMAVKNGILLIEDLGSGVLIDLKKFALPPEPKVQDSISAGADLVTFSGDKMLGGPQAGIIVGCKDLVSRIRNNQLARTLRVDKFTIAALEATLRLYLDEETALQEIPVWRMLTSAKDELRERAEKMADQFKAIFGNEKVEVVEGVSKVGGGALPTAELPTCLVKITPGEGAPSPSEISDQLRRGEPPVILRLQQNSLLIDPRTVFENQEAVLYEALERAFNL